MGENLGYTINNYILFSWNGFLGLDSAFFIGVEKEDFSQEASKVLLNSIVRPLYPVVKSFTVNKKWWVALINNCRPTRRLLNPTTCQWREAENHDKNQKKWVIMLHETFRASNKPTFLFAYSRQFMLASKTFYLVLSILKNSYIHRKNKEKFDFDGPI